MSDRTIKGMALFQIEIDRYRWKCLGNIGGRLDKITPMETLVQIIQRCAQDVLQNEGTLVLVATGSTITLVQRENDYEDPFADEGEDAAEQSNSNGENCGLDVDSATGGTEPLTQQGTQSKE